MVWKRKSQSRSKTKPHGSRRDEVVRAAYRLIARKGFEGLRLREVARHAGIDHSTLHHHFGTKSDLVAAVLDFATGQFRSPGPSPQVPETLDEHLAFLGQMIVKDPELHTVLREFDLHGRRNSRVRAIIARGEQGWRDRLFLRIRQAKTDGHWPSGLDAATGVELVIAVVKGSSFNAQAAHQTMGLFQRLLDAKSAHG